MKVGLYDVDSTIPNLALMKLSSWHKSQGDEVDWYSPLIHRDYDLIYASKVFSNSPAAYIRSNMIIGGSGSNLGKELPLLIEHIYPDYSLYDADYALGFITRGCSRNCNFCIVPQKEGPIRKHAEVSEFWKDQEKIMLLDNNILAYKYHKKELKKLIKLERKVDFNQGFDIRLVSKDNAILIRKLRRWDGIRYRFALDHPALIPMVEKKIKILNDAGITNGIMMFYVLVGFNTTREEDMKRIEFLKNKKIYPYIMPYKRTKYTLKFKRWVNRCFYKYESFQDYLKGVKI